MTTIDAAVNAIKQTQAQMQARIDLLEESDRNADLVITMLVGALQEVMVSGATTKARRDRCKGALRFAAAHIGEDAA